MWSVEALITQLTRAMAREAALTARRRWSFLIGTLTPWMGLMRIPSGMEEI